MASSSVSQDDVDNNFEKNSRRSRIRTARARQINPSGCRTESQNVVDTDEIAALAVATGEDQVRHNSTSAPGDQAGGGNADHETSPKPILRSTKESSKRPNKPHHVNKGKQQRDRRKLREKRRSTGVVHLASTESTGGSTTGDDEESSDAGAINAAAASGTNNISAETRKNTLQNESNCYDDQLLSSNFKVQNSSSDLSNGGSALYHHHQHQSRSGHGNSSGGLQRRNKSLSDLEADDENDHDSLNQSEGSCSQQGGSSNSNHKMAKLSQFQTNSAIQNSTERSEDEVRRVLEENQRLLSMMEEKDRRIHMLEFKVQQLMRDTLMISEDQSRLQKENSTLLRALSKLTVDRHNRATQPQPSVEDQPS